jgi:hypothetical protein
MSVCETPEEKPSGRPPVQAEEALSRESNGTMACKLVNTLSSKSFRSMVAFFFWAEMFVAFALILAMFLSILYYAIPFVEERVRLVAKFGLGWCLVNIGLSLFIIPAGYGAAAFWSTFLTNCAWLSVLSRGFPYISIFSLDLLIGTIGTIVSHACWLLAVLRTSLGAFPALGYYLALVWGLPILVVIGLSVTDESGARLGKGSRSVWAKIIDAIIAFVRGLMPGHKRE